MPRLVNALRLARPGFALAALAAAAAVSPACGGGNTHDGNPTATMALINFEQAGINNLALNSKLVFHFSEAVDAQATNSASLQVKEGPAFGSEVSGTFRVSGSQVVFEPKLPGLCDISDGGFKPDTQYRITLVGWPEQFCLRRDDGNPGTATGDPLKGTLNFEFHTRAVDDPLLFTDQIAATPPVVTQTSPVDGTACVKVEQGTNKVTIDISENLRPCSVTTNTVLVDEYQRGNPNVFLTDPISNRASGFTPIADADIPNKLSWGPIDLVPAPGESALSPAQRVACTIGLVQDFLGTHITATPKFGQFPENALIVVQLTFGITDFGGQALVPYVFAFTTENLTPQTGQYIVRWQGETPVLKDQSTADVNTLRSPLVAQGWLLFAGDADNGTNQLQPSGPANNPPTCNNPRQANDGAKDDFDPNSDVVFDTGLTVNTCANKTDGSTAVVWEFRTFRIRAGRTIRVMGVNPAIFLVQGDIAIDTGGRFQIRGDAVGGTPDGNGNNGSNAVNTAHPGGTGVAGGGSGGQAYALYNSNPTGDSGRSGFGSPSGFNVVGGSGSGLGGSQAQHSSFATNYGSGLGGGGGGHASVGSQGGNNRNAAMTYLSASVPGGGATYPAMDNRLLTPSAGSGAGGGGYGGYAGTQSFAGYDGSGGGGGSGGGFVDLTSSGNIIIAGTIDAAGGRGGSAGTGFYAAGGGGGGGSGGGVRLLTPNDINISGATITTAGGNGGSGANTGAQGAGYAGGPANPGGAGGKGRIVMEDKDSLIAGIGGATLNPAEGDASGGFYRGIFDATRFKGGGLEPAVITDIFQLGPREPSLVPPVQADFIASVPTGADRGLNGTCCLIEARGYQMLADGTVDLVGGPTPYYTIGYLKHSGVASLPTWTGNLNPGDITLPAGNAGPVGALLNGREFWQLRVTFYLPNTIGPFDPGPILDDWTIRFSFNQ